MKPAEMFTPMNPDEAKAKRLLDELVSHCQQARLPLVVVVGMVESRAVARGWSEFATDQTREIMREHVRAILWPNGN